MNFYNDTEPYVAQWLRNLAAARHIGVGDVSETPIQDLEAWQLSGYKRCHFFAGIGGWEYALQLAGWPENVPVWTGSCPCQPFSIAGKRKREKDERHLWPFFRELIRQCKPPVIFGEQVASKDGRKWLSRVRSDLEEMGYAVGAADLCAASVGAPHVRQRLYWIASANNRSERIQRIVPQKICRESSFSWCENVGRVTNLRGRSDIPEPLLRTYRNGFPSGMEQVRAYGNAIIPQVAAEFIKAVMDVIFV